MDFNPFIGRTRQANAMAGLENCHPRCAATFRAILRMKSALVTFIEKRLWSGEVSMVDRWRELQGAISAPRHRLRSDGRKEEA